MIKLSYPAAQLYHSIPFVTCLWSSKKIESFYSIRTTTRSGISMHGSFIDPSFAVAYLRKAFSDKKISQARYTLLMDSIVADFVRVDFSNIIRSHADLPCAEAPKSLDHWDRKPFSGTLSNQFSVFRAEDFLHSEKSESPQPEKPKRTHAYVFGDTNSHVELKEGEITELPGDPLNRKFAYIVNKGKTVFLIGDDDKEEDKDINPHVNILFPNYPVIPMKGRVIALSPNALLHESSGSKSGIPKDAKKRKRGASTTI